MNKEPRTKADIDNRNLKELVLELVKLKEQMTALDFLEDSTRYMKARDRLEEIVDEIARAVLVGEGSE